MPRKPVEPETPEQTDEDAPQELDAVVVTKVKDAEGNITTEVSLLGDVLATEVQTLLELGIKGWRKANGLGP